MTKKQNNLIVDGKILPNGISIIVNGKSYAIKYPKEIWAKTPKSVKEALIENVIFGTTNYLSLVFNEEKITYKTKVPLFESQLFKNQLYDMTSCERSDNVKHLSYVKDFYNTEYEFAPGDSTIPSRNDIPRFQTKKPKVVLPFTFGKESLLAFALCLELGIEPILVYSQEPSHSYEKDYKLKQLKALEKKYKIKTYFIENEPGLFRYGLAFDKKVGTELGWGLQTTLLSLLSLPFVFYHEAKYILLGNEQSNNDYEYRKDWKLYYSYDQSGQWLSQQNNMIRLLTDDQCKLKTTLQTLDQGSIFYILQHRYPEIGKTQFSCHGKYPLYKNSQWCHQCDKCEKMFLFARGFGIDPAKIGFKKDLFLNKNFSEKIYSKGMPEYEAEFCFYLLHKRGDKSEAVKTFEKKMLKKIKPWKFLHEFTTELKPSTNDVEEYKEKIYKIFKSELDYLKKTIPKRND